MAMGYSGPPALTLTTAFTQWTADGPMIALVVLLGGGYLAGLRRARRGVAQRGGRPWPAGRAIAFCGLGLGFLVYATMSWVGTYQGVLFYARATQTVLLVLVVPLFLAMGRPLTLLSAAAPAIGRRVEKIVRSKLAVALTFPAVPTFALIAVPFVMYFTTWYTAAFHSGAVRELTYLVLMATGYLYFWTFLRVDPVPKNYNRAVSMWITAAQVVGDAFFGIAVIADQNLIALHYYQALHRPFGPTFATDQVLGGGVLWILGDFVGVPFLAAQFIHAMREDKAEAARIDAELDARDAATAATRQAAREAMRETARQVGAWGGGREGEPVTGRDPGAAVDALADEVEDAAERPWWEDDPRFANRFRRGRG
jgi:cytochrome c oxidase assembly factor CtaG